MSGAKEPHLLLVRTWMRLLITSTNTEVKNRSRKLLLNKFGDINSASEFCIENGINIRLMETK